MPPQISRYYLQNPREIWRAARLTERKFKLTFPHYKTAVPLWQKIIVITPTYNRPQRLNYIRRIARVLRGIPDLTWILIEDGANPDPLVQKILLTSGIEHIYLHTGPSRDKGNSQRNLGIDHIRKMKMNGVIYFADDDNYFNQKLFSEIRKTKRISLLPVGRLGPHGIERPLVGHGAIIGWDAGWLERKFPVDMGGFAIHSRLFLNKPDTLWFYNIHGGETELLEMFIDSPQELEILCNQCQTCYVWHNQPLGEPILITMIKIKLKNIIKTAWTMINAPNQKGSLR